MAQVLVCPRGHEWEASLTEADQQTEQAALLCPVCGASGTWLQSTVLAPPGDPTAAFTPDQVKKLDLPQIPGYQVTGLLGRGGMGAVYRARQVRLNREVALKVILAGRQILPMQRLRFQFEAEALARLQHPNIVQVFEVGEHDGAPFLALELIEGGSLAEHLCDRPMAARPAAELLACVARAVHAAHQRGIVHRDLKPGNILLQNSSGGSTLLDLRAAGRLTAAVVPKVTDFGLAKRLEQGSEQTQPGMILGTPSYMAPEQALGDPKAVGPLADVYALGVMLYEMLTARTPFRGSSPFETLDLLRRVEPLPPRHWRSAVPRDLETICLKCLQKDPNRRYPTAEALADDLERFVDSRPIRARRVGPLERALKWSWRHPLGAALLVIVLLSGLWFAWSLVRLREAAQRDREQLALLRQALANLRFVDGPLADEPFHDPAQQEMLETTLQLYESLARQVSDDPAVRRETALAYVRVGQLRRKLNRLALAEEAYGKAIERQQGLHSEYASDLTYLDDLTASHIELGELLRDAGRPLEEAKKCFEQARALQQGRGRLEEARSHNRLGIIAQETEQLARALDHFDQAISLLQRFLADEPGRPDVRFELARCRLNRGVLHKQQREFDRAANDYREALVLLDELQKDYPARAEYRQDLALAHQDLAHVHELQKHFELALRELEQARTTMQELARQFRTRPSYRFQLADFLNSMGSAQARAGQLAEAEKTWQQAAAVLEPLIATYPGVSRYRHRLGLVLGNLAWLLSEQKRYADAQRWMERAERELQEARAATPDNGDIRLALRRQYQSLAEVRLQLRDHAGAAAAARALAELSTEQAQETYYAACFLARCLPLASPDSAAGYRAEVLALLQRAGRVRGPRLERLKQEREVFGPFAHGDAVQAALAALPSQPAD